MYHNLAFILHYRHILHLRLCRPTRTALDIRPCFIPLDFTLLSRPTEHHLSYRIIRAQADLPSFRLLAILSRSLVPRPCEVASSTIRLSCLPLLSPCSILRRLGIGGLLTCSLTCGKGGGFFLLKTIKVAVRSLNIEIKGKLFSQLCSCPPST